MNEGNEIRILNRKIYLYMTEFFAGMSVMAVELAASRFLAPYFSSSQIVWTIIIGTIMIAMALGNIYGGRSADKNPNPDKLYGRILISAVWIAAIPFLGKLVIIGVSGLLVVAVSTNFLIWAAFITCMIVFVFPLFLLGTVTPSLVKYTVDSLDDSGKTVGALGAANTIGSIIGTFVPTFVSIPAVGTAMTFLIFSGILLALGLIYFISCKKGIVRCIAALVLFIAFFCCGNLTGFAFWEDNITYEGESVYNYLQIKEQGNMTMLSTNVLFGTQSVDVKDGSLTGMYYDYALAAPYMTETDGTKDILILGMGTGTYAKQCRRYVGDVNVSGVEIDGKITSLAYSYFNLPKDIPVTEFDGRAYLAADDKKYDVIMVDAYRDISIPFQMSSVEFFTSVKEHLNDNGVLVVNMNMISEDDDGINAYLSDTVSAVFGNVYTADVLGSENRVLFASDNGGMIDAFKRNTSNLDDKSLKMLMDRVGKGIERYSPTGKILTDDKAPVELLSMSAIDGLIGGELSYYKDIIREQGIEGLMNSF